MNKHIEMIIDYVIDGGDDFKYFDNHGVLIRCKDCKHWTNNIPDNPNIRELFCNRAQAGWFFECKSDDYCSWAEKKVEE